MSTSDRGPGVWFPPPLLFVAGFVAARLLDGWLPFEIDDDGGGAIQSAVGTGAIVAGLALMFWGLLTFVRARTTVYPNSPARRLVEYGPYRFSRNPMYVGLTVAYLGLAIEINAVWPILMLPVVLAALVRFVIRREERHLEQVFGDEYRDYRARVRRFV